MRRRQWQAGGAVLIVGGLAVAGAVGQGAQNPFKITVQTTRDELPPAVVAIAPIDVSPARESAFRAADEIASVLHYDLDFTGRVLFVGQDKQVWVKEQHEKDKTAGRINFAAWRQELRADYVIKGEYEETTDGQFRLKLLLYDTATTAAEPRQSYAGAPRQLRESVHQFSDLAIPKLTGQRGIATSLIAYIYDDGTCRELYLMDYDGKNQRRKTRDQSLALFPAWSPDNSRIAFTSYRGGGTHVYLLDVLSGSLSRVTSYPGMNSQPTWHPDGKELCLVMSQPGNVELFRLPLGSRGGKPQRLSFKRSTEASPCWSPDGRRILFTSDRNGRAAIFVMDANGTNVQSLTDSIRGLCDNARWSPDGSRIVFQARQRGEFNLYLMDARGQNVQQITTGPGNKESPSWSPDGQHIAFSWDKTGSPQIYVLSLGNNRTRQLTSVKGKALHPAWSR